MMFCSENFVTDFDRAHDACERDPSLNPEVFYKDALAAARTLLGYDENIRFHLVDLRCENFPQARILVEVGQYVRENPTQAEKAKLLSQIAETLFSQPATDSQVCLRLAA